MNGSVVDLEAFRPHLSGPCRCLDCKHEWEGVAVVGTTTMTCPSCGANKGGRFSMVLPPEERGYWACNCGNIFFVITPDHTVCPNCGEHQRFEP